MKVNTRNPIFTLVWVTIATIVFLFVYWAQAADSRKANSFDTQPESSANKADLKPNSLESPEHQASAVKYEDASVAEKQVEHPTTPGANIEPPIRQLLATNDFVTLSCATGEISHFDAQGIILKSEGDFLPRIFWASLNNDDARALLRSPKVFNGTTFFGLNNKATYKASTFTRPDLEQQMGRMWLKGASVKARLITRIAVLEMCRTYNQSRWQYFAALLNSQAYRRQAEAQSRQEAATYATQSGGGLNAGQFFALSPEAQEDYLSGRIGGSSSDILRQLAVHQLVVASGQQDNATRSDARRKANEYQQMSHGEAEEAAAEARKLIRCRDTLARMGFAFARTNELPLIPAMDLKREVLTDLNSEPVKDATP